MRHKLLIAVFSLIAACAPKLGDDCSNSLECSAVGDRYCDVSQPGGYCTIQNCEPGACGDEGVCVRFRPDEPRLASSWCMAKCSNRGDCDRDKYTCRSADQLNESVAPDAPRHAEVLDSKKSQKFCVVKED
ncbi:MAG TPA: hypothetical protein VI299_13690 [Polyangiales bacterium]